MKFRPKIPANPLKTILLEALGGENSLSYRNNTSLKLVLPISKVLLPSQTRRQELLSSSI
jgi:hypothetical protein